MAATRRQLVRVARFDAVQRTAHWTQAGLFGVLMVTGFALYFGSFFGVVLARHTIAEIHLWCGVALPAPLIISLLGPWGRQMRDDVRRVSRWTHAEIRWLTSLGRTPLRQGKFNPGQKLNAIFVAAVIPVMLATGSIMWWFRFFPVDLRTNATFVHDIFALTIYVVVVGHVLMAVTHRESLWSMLRGWVSERWAQAHAPAWLDELEPLGERAASDRVPSRSVRSPRG